MRRRHNYIGTDDACKSPLIQLLELEQTPRHLKYDLPEFGRRRRILRGQPLDDIDVGSKLWLPCLAQYPPAQGDTWELDVQLQRGRYILSLSGWVNPFHGVLDLRLGDLQVAAWDWRAAATHEKTFSVRLEVHNTGTHTLRGETNRSTAPLQSEGHFWMCLRELRIVADEDAAEREWGTALH